MANYSINGNPISNYGCIASPKESGCLAITGAFDFPARDGDIEHDWGSETEPFLNALDMKFKPNVCTLSLFLSGTNNAIYQQSLTNIKSQLTNMGYLSSSYGLFLDQIKTTGEINVNEFLNKNCAKVEAKFEVANGVLSGTLGTASGGSGYLLSNYNLKADFSLLVQRRIDNKSFGSFKDADTTEPYEKSITIREPRDIGLDVVIMTIDIPSFLNKISRFHQLLSLPNPLVLRFPDGQTINVFCRDGFKISRIQILGGIYAKFYLKLREIL